MAWAALYSVPARESLSMISFFRRFTSSWLAGAILLLIAIAILVTGIGTPSGLGNMSLQGDSVASMGRHHVSATELERHVVSQLDMAKRQNPEQNAGLDMPGFIAGGGFESGYVDYVTGKAIEFFGLDQGMVASKLVLDRQIAQIPAFHGPTGEFDQQVFESVLGQQRLTPADFRKDLAGAFIRQQLLVPVAGSPQLPLGMATAYAGLMLETRNGVVGAVPSALMAAGPAPTEAEIAAHYTKIRGSFMVPEQRALKYAVFGVENVPNAVPTDADVAAYYKANAAKYAAVEARTLSQVVLPDQAAANAFSAKIKAGQSFDVTAKAAGFAPSDTAIGAKSRADLAAFSSDAVAAAAFALPKGGVSVPVQSDLGWHVVRVDAIQITPGKTLAQARPEIFGSLARQKGDEAMIDLVNKIEDQLAEGASLDEVAKTFNLTVVKSPLLTVNGQSVDGKPVTIAPELAGLLKSGFAMGADDEPMVETLTPNKRFAMLGVDQTVPAAPLSLDKVRPQVVADLIARRGAAAAQKLAASIAAKVNAGTSMAEAFAAAKLPAPKGVSARRVDLAKQQNVPAPVVMMFSMAKGKAKLLAAPNNQGWMVVYVADVQQGNIAEAPALIAQSREEIRSQMGNEYAAQFANAAKVALGFKENKAQLLALKKRLSGAAAE